MIRSSDVDVVGVMAVFILFTLSSKEDLACNQIMLLYHPPWPWWMVVLSREPRFERASERRGSERDGTGAHHNEHPTTYFIYSALKRASRGLSKYEKTSVTNIAFPKIEKSKALA
jgi:hypothetical protein